MAMRRAAKNIIVSRHLQRIADYDKNVEIIPCGADDNLFTSVEKKKAREKLGWDVDGKYILFAGAFDRDVKNPQLAKDSVAKLRDAKLVELKGYSREEVKFLLNASDCLLMTSQNEGSPQIIKEAMLCRTPIVSVNVGDVEDVTEGVDGCYIVNSNPEDISDALNKALRHDKTNGREAIYAKGLTLPLVASRILALYNEILDK